jgi:hypothetical protein
MNGTYERVPRPSVHAALVADFHLTERGTDIASGRR